MRLLSSSARLFFLLTLLFSPLYSFEWQENQGDVKVTYSVHPEALTPSTLLKVQLTIHYPLGLAPHLPSVSRNILAHPEGGEPSWELKSERISPPQRKGESQWAQTAHWTFLPHSSGSLFLSPGELNLHSDDSLQAHQTLFLPTLAFHLDPVEEEQLHSPSSQELLPLDGNGEVTMAPQIRQQLINTPTQKEKANKQLLQAWQERHFPWRVLFAALGAMLLLTATLWVKRWWEQSTPSSSLSAPLSPREKAMEALQELHAKQLPQEGEFDQYYVHLTSILRHYIEEQWQVRAPEQTTQEFLRELSISQPFSQPTQRTLAAFLHCADMVKFARQRPTLDECDQALHHAKEFIWKESGV